MQNKKRNSIYKFCSFNKYSLTNISKNQIYCNHYSVFNDPFECWAITNTGIPDPIKNENRFLNIIKVWGFTPDRKEEALEYYHNYLEHFIQDQIDVDNYINSARICCFSSNSQNLLMWAHYANGLRGFCIEYDSTQLSNEAVIIPVNYFKSPSILEAISYPLANDIYWHAEDEDSDNAVNYIKDFYSKMLATKPIEWKYEKEIRLIFHTESENKKGEGLKYPESAIKSIIIGEKASKENIQHLKSIISENNITIPFFIAKRDRNNYKVIIELL
jgi:hypothetical protein